MYRIGAFSKLCKTTVKTLRYYDTVGLLKPECIDQWTGHRFYTTKQLVELHRIQCFRQMGLSIEEIQRILGGESAKEILQTRMEQLQEEICTANAQLVRIAFILSGEGEIYMENVQVTVKDLPKCIVYSKQLTIPNYEVYFTVLPAVGQQVKTKYPDLKCLEPNYCFIRYLDGEYKEKDIRIEYCEAVNQLKPDFDDIVFKEIPSVPALSIMHKGPYERLREAYAYAYRWMAENGYTAADCPRESYIDGIWNEEDKEKWLTEIQIPIIK